MQRPRVLQLACLLLICLQPIGSQIRAAPLTGSGGINLRISPLVLEESGFPGEVLHTVLEIKNISKSFLPLHTYSRDVSAKDEYGDLGLDSIQPELRAESWLHVEQTDRILEPDSTTEIDVTTTIPINTAPGDRSVALFFNPTTADLTNHNTAVGVQTQVGSVFFITVKGATVENGQISDFLVPTPYDAQSFTIRFQNTGNVRSKLTGLIVLNDWRGHNLQTLAVEDYGSLTSLPGKQRSLTVPWSGKSGLYSANLTLRSSSGKHYTSSKWFIVANHLQIGILLFIIISFLITVYYLVRLIYRRNSKT